MRSMGARLISYPPFDLSAQPRADGMEYCSPGQLEVEKLSSSLAQTLDLSLLGLRHGYPI